MVNYTSLLFAVPHDTGAKKLRDANWSVDFRKKTGCEK